MFAPIYSTRFSSRFFCARRAHFRMMQSLLVLLFGCVFFGLSTQAQAAVSFVQGNGNGASNTTTVTATFGSAPTQNNLLVAIASTRVTPTSINAPSGWSTAISQLAAPGQAIFYKIAGAVESSSVTVTVTGTNNVLGLAILEYSGIDTTSPFVSGGTTNSMTGSDDTPQTGSVLPTTAPALLIAQVVLISPTDGTFTFSPASNFNKLGDFNVANGAAQINIAAAHRLVAALGTYSTQATFDGGAGNWRGQIAAFRAAGPTVAETSIRGRVTEEDGNGLAGVTLKLSGSESSRAITDSQGYYYFTGLSADGFYTITPQLANHSFGPSSRSFSLLSNQTEAPFTATPSAETANPLDTSEYFVRQHYLDFLDREPDAAGFNYWASQFDSCGADALCLSSRRIDVSAAYFMSDEFQLTGSFVYGLYKGGLGRNPKFNEFMPDRNQVVGGSSLQESKQALADNWVTRAEFKSTYPDTLSNVEFVNKLFDTAGLSGYSAERQTFITAMQNGASRSQVLLGVIESNAFKTKEYNRAFVLTQYFGYLRRDPDDAGLEFWLGVLNTREPNNYRGMVCSFLTSAEYQKRFSSVVTHSNSECGQ